MSPAPSPRVLWWLLVAGAGGYFALFAFFPNLYLFVGVNHFGAWFLDTYAILASNDAISIGRDPYAINPLDPFGRPHVYTHWWLHLRDLGLTRADNFVLGALCGLVFFVAAIARLRPRALSELVWYLAILCSSPVLLALNRANNDLIVFAVLAPVVPCLLSRQRAWRLMAVPLLAIAAGLKFYPAVAGLVLLAGDDKSEVRGRVLFGFVALGLVGVNLAHDFALFRAHAPRADGIMTFGALNLPASLGLSERTATLVGLIAGAAIFAVFWCARIFSDWTIAVEERGAWLSFALGAVLLAGCFFIGSNYAYRWVYALWMAPLLWQLPRDPLVPVAVRRLARVTGWLLLLELWIDPAASMMLGNLPGHVAGDVIMAWADRIFRYEQPIAWAFFVCLLAFLAHFTRDGVRTLLGRA